jgi:hypothetical protein
MQNGIKYIDKTSILFSGDNYIIVEEIWDKKQRIFREHKGKVISLDVIEE